MATEREGSHSVLCREPEFNLDIGHAVHGRSVDRLEVAGSAQPQIMEMLRGWSDACERCPVASQALIAFCLDGSQKSFSQFAKVRCLRSIRIVFRY